MTDANMTAHAGSQWIDFWQNLKTGHDLFEAERIPPRVGVDDKRYVFTADRAPVTLRTGD